MREILFRGRRRPEDITQGWVYGTFHPAMDKKGAFIVTENFIMIPVVRDTVGQYTGLTDKNGVRIFEGDIVCCDGCFTGPYNALVEFFGSAWMLTNPHMPTDNMFPPEFMEITGNIHDNPELLEEADKEGVGENAHDSDKTDSVL